VQEVHHARADRQVFPRGFEEIPHEVAHGVVQIRQADRSPEVRGVGRYPPRQVSIAPWPVRVCMKSNSTISIRPTTMRLIGGVMAGDGGPQVAKHSRRAPGRC